MALNQGECSRVTCPEVLGTDNLEQHKHPETVEHIYQTATATPNVFPTSETCKYLHHTPM